MQAQNIVANIFVSQVQDMKNFITQESLCYNSYIRSTQSLLIWPEGLIWHVKDYTPKLSWPGPTLTRGSVLLRSGFPSPLYYPHLLGATKEKLFWSDLHNMLLVLHLKEEITEIDEHLSNLPFLIIWHFILIKAESERSLCLLNGLYGGLLQNKNRKGLDYTFWEQGNCCSMATRVWQDHKKESLISWFSSISKVQSQADTIC